MKYNFIHSLALWIGSSIIKFLKRTKQNSNEIEKKYCIGSLIIIIDQHVVERVLEATDGSF